MSRNISNFVEEANWFASQMSFEVRLAPHHNVQLGDDVTIQMAGSTRPRDLRVTEVNGNTLRMVRLDTVAAREDHRETWSVQPVVVRPGAETGYVVWRGSHHFAGPFPTEAMATDIMKVILKVIDTRQQQQPDVPIGTRAMDITTLAEKELRARVHELEGALDSVMGEIARSPDVHMGIPMKSVRYSPDRIRYLVDILKGIKADEDNSAAQGNLPGRNDGGRRRGMRILD